jgi:uncharacterized protein YrzB (UPF0473 family)
MEYEDNQIVLVDEDGEEIRFYLIDAVMVDNKKYVLLQPVESDEEEDEGSAFLFRVDDDQDEEVLVAVDDDEEIQMVEDALADFDSDENDEDDDVF